MRKTRRENIHAHQSDRRSRTVPVRSQRHGSVLLIVVVLLLIMAILGATYLASTRTDRLTSAQDVTNSQIDSLTDGVRDLANSYIVNSLFALNNNKGGYQYQYRGGSQLAAATVFPPNTPPGNVQNILPYNNFDMPVYTTLQVNNNNGDLWLADRVPSVGPVWNAITGPLNGLGAAGAGTFEDPTLASTVSHWTPYVAPFGSAPTFKLVGNAVYPALTNSSGTFVAADADGDGIADAGLIRLPGVYSDGLTYYAGIRIIDNNSAINVNTAGNYQYDYDVKGNPTPTIPNSASIFPSYFPSAVGINFLLDLREQTYSGAPAGLPEPQALNYFRLNFFNTGNKLPPANTGNANQVMAIDDTGKAHTDFGYATLGDAMYHQMSRRLENPGYLDQASPTKHRFNTFGDADAAALAYHFCLINPNAYPSIAGGSPVAITPIETFLNFSTFQNVINYTPLVLPPIVPSTAPLASGWRAYPSPVATTSAQVTTDAATVTKRWYNDNFNYTDATGTVAPLPPNLRPLLTTRNGVSITAPANSANPAGFPPTVPAGMVPYGDRGRWQSTVPYYINDVVTYATTPTAPNYNSYDYNELSSQVYFCTTANTNTPPTPPLNADGSANADWTTIMPAAWVPPASATMVKANINTALFPELYRAFWNVMYAGANASPPYTAPMFRSPTGLGSLQARDTFSVNLLTTQQVLQLRAAIAAVNVENLRSPDPVTGLRNVIGRQILLGTNTPGGPQMFAIVYGNQPQPYITEVYAQTDITSISGKANPAGYVAVELYNPNSFPIPLVSTSTADSSWAIAIVNRITNPTVTPRTVLPITTTATSTIPLNIANYPLDGSGPNGIPIIPAGGYLILENYNPSGGGTAAYRPVSSGLPAQGPIPNSNATTKNGVVDRSTLSPPLPSLNEIYIPNLAQVAGNEMVIMKRRHADGTAFATAASATGDSYVWGDNENQTLPANNATVLNDFVPVDSYDFTGLPLGSASAAYELHYVRPSQNAEYVYPGPYNGNGATPDLRQVGTVFNTWVNPNSTSNQDPWIAAPPTPALSLGTFYTNAPTTNAGSTSGFTPHSIQLWNSNWAGPNKAVAAGSNGYPFGGFARNGDILETPFIGSYEIFTVNAGVRTIVDVNCVTMDAAFADDMDSTDDAYEQVGRFCPIVPAPTGSTINDLFPNSSTNTAHYWWARSLFDYLTVQDPRDDYFPNTNPSRYPPTYYGSPLAPAPTPVADSNADPSVPANTESENTQSVQGLVNINTAPLPVLAALPLAVDNMGNVDLTPDPVTTFPKNVAIAQAIINDRTANGPFASIFDLNRVKDSAGNYVFQTGAGDVAFTGTTTASQGNVSRLPVGAGSPPPPVPQEFDERYLQITRLSNLIATRSDTFTVYVVVEGWQNAGSTVAALPPKLVVTRRAAFIVDRNSVTPTSRVVKTVTVPNN